ncbi:MAG TPA: sterol desaturase family protein [Polyangia bacterium]|jgi:sterol desaturase/sphingolipid hydroxylase (fatty acid hydroxylase superfamily)
MIEDVAPLAIPVLFIAFIIAEVIRPARKLPKVSWWQLKGVLFFVMTGVIASVLPFAWQGFVDKHALLHLSRFGTVGGAAAGYVLFQLATYWWHRLQHTSSFLWRWSHQIHHSAERVDIYGVGLFHPFDVAAFTALGSIVYSLLLGLSPAAVALANVYGLFASFLQHANIRTPRWLGYIIQRPEAHGIHHQRGVHGYNYADLPLWDMVFGTFRNPAIWREQAGFYEGGSKRIGAMLIGRDISTPESNPMSSRPEAYREPARAAA